MPDLWNGRLMKCQNDEMASWWRQQAYEMASWSNERWSNGKLIKWKADEMASWWHG